MQIIEKMLYESDEKPEKKKETKGSQYLKKALPTLKFPF
jgi:hypothetical protein